MRVTVKILIDDERAYRKTIAQVESTQLASSNDTLGLVYRMTTEAERVIAQQLDFIEVNARQLNSGDL